MRYTSKNSDIVLTERQAQVLLAARSGRLDTNSGAAYFQTTQSAFMRVAYKVTHLGLVWFDIVSFTPREYMIYASDEGEKWLDGCEKPPLLPPLMSFVANMPG